MTYTAAVRSYPGYGSSLEEQKSGPSIGCFMEEWRGTIPRLK
jgi:hypothetical protein